MGLRRPTWYVGIPGGAPSNHLFVIGVRGGTFVGGSNEFATCPEAVVIGRTDVRHRTAMFLACGGESELNSGHVVIRWRVRGLLYEVSLHNASTVNQRIAETIADSVVRVG